jgi:hypothetical protein
VIAATLLLVGVQVKAAQYRLNLETAADSADKRN